ncbi:hypothetical protein Smp_128760 [Schistosoma mansoni]|uniref:hypothetical protein n=1 Tax=Schistosoma mansoni TaxID=6183 RepID=UPI0001A645C9|nr:hypothetical protein Smp_128760 [Schistosoma mansoni]|eukprot:XP_018650107.1 hypothetical protein Smp_128760 [Schistosoma mansoni]
MSNSTNITTTAIVDNNNNSSETKSDKIIQTTASIDELIYGLYHITMEISPTCRQAATLFLSGFFVVGVLLIIPALMQTAAAYVWAAQIRRESVTPTQLQQSKKNQSISKNNSNKIQKQIRKHRLPKQDRTLFLYRILACTASLLVLIFSTLPHCTFVLATLRSMLSEIQEERRKRSMLLYDETTHDSSKQQSSSSRNKTTIRIADNNNTTNQMHGTKRRTNLIHGLQKQFSVAYRWKPDFTDEETGFISGQLDELSMEQSTNQNISSINDNESNVFDIENETNEKCTDDAMLHYAILQRSASLKRKEQEQRIKPQINTSYNIMRNLNTQQHQPKQQHTILYSINN